MGRRKIKKWIARAKERGYTKDQAIKMFASSSASKKDTLRLLKYWNEDPPPKRNKTFLILSAFLILSVIIVATFFIPSSSNMSIAEVGIEKVVGVVSFSRGIDIGDTPYDENAIVSEKDADKNPDELPIEKPKPSPPFVRQPIYEPETKWKISKTGNEKNLDVNYEIINKTATEFCITYIDKEKYISNAVLSKEKIEEVPISKISSSAFSIEKTKMDLTKIKNTKDKCFTVNYDKFEIGMEFKIGWNSVVVVSTTEAGALAMQTSSKLAKDSNGNLYIGYSTNSRDLGFANSSDNGMTWSSQYITSNRWGVNLLINSSDDLHLFSDSGSSLNHRVSTDLGVTWDSIYFPADGDFPSCAIDSNDVIHCCYKDGETKYSNSSDWSEEISLGNYYCSIAIDENDVVYITTGDRVAYSDIKIYDSNRGLDRDNDYNIETDTGGYSYGKTSTTAICGDNVYVAGISYSDLYLYNNTVGNINTTWTKTLIDADASFSPNIACNEYGSVEIYYKTQADSSTHEEVLSTDTLYRANSTDFGRTWTSRTSVLSQGGYGNILDTTFPSNNDLTDTVNYVYQDYTGVIYFDNYTISSPPLVSFESPTPPNATVTEDNSLIVNVSIAESSLEEFVYDWNGTNFTAYDDSLILMLNFNNVSALGESQTLVKDASANGKDGTVYGDGDEIVANGKYGGGLDLDGTADYVKMNNLIDVGTGDFSIEMWFKTTSTAANYLMSNKDDYTGYFTRVGLNAGNLRMYTESNNGNNELFSTAGTYHDGEWHHVVFTRDGSVGKIIVDGGKEIKTGATEAGDVGTTDFWWIGQGGNNNAYFNGEIDETRVWTKALSLTEVNQSYISNLRKLDLSNWNFQSSQTNRDLSGNVAYTYQAFTSDSTGATGRTEERTITFSPAYPQISFTAPTPPSGTTTTNTSLIINTTFGTSSLKNIEYNWNGTNFTMYDDELYLMYNFDNMSSLGESYTASDSTVVELSTFNANGTAKNSLGGGWNSTGKYNGALDFDGTNDYITAPTLTEMDGITDWTLSAWLHPDDLVGDQYYFANQLGISGSTKPGFYSRVYGAKIRTMVYETSPAGYFYVTTDNDVLTANTWNYVTTVYNAPAHTIDIYVNGIEVASTRITSGTLPSVLDLTNAATEIGRGSVSGGYSGYFGGQIDEVRIFGKGLSESEIYQQYVSNLRKVDSGAWELYVGQSANVSGELVEGTYTYQAFISDSIDNLNQTEERTYIVGEPETPPAANLLSPENNSVSITHSNNFTVNVTDGQGLKNATLHIYNSSGDEVNQTTYTFSGTVLKYTVGIVVVLADGVYDWFYNVFDNAENEVTTGNYSLAINTSENLNCWFNPTHQETGTRDVWCNVTDALGNPVLNANISHSTYDTNDWYNAGLMSEKGWIIGYQPVPNAYNISANNHTIYETKTIDSTKRGHIKYGSFSFPFEHIKQDFSVLLKAGSGATALRVMVCNDTYANEVIGHTPINLTRTGNYSGCQLAGIINATEQGINYNNWTWGTVDVTSAYNNMTANQIGTMDYSIHLSSYDEEVINPVGWGIPENWMPPYHNETKEVFALSNNSYNSTDNFFYPDNRVHDNATAWTTQDVLNVSNTITFNATTGYPVFDSDDDYMMPLNYSSYENIRNSSFSTCMYFKRSDTSIKNQRQYLDSWGKAMNLYVYAHDIRFYVRARSPYYAKTISTTGDLVLDTNWHHICGVRDKENEEVYIVLDGEKVSSGYFNGSRELSHTDFDQSQNDLVIGRDIPAGGSDDGFRGEIAQYMLHNDSHTASEIKEGINNAWWSLAIGEQTTDNVYAVGTLINSTTYEWGSEPDHTPIAFTKIYNMNNDTAYMTYNATEELYHSTYYTSQPQFATSQGIDGVNFTTLFEYNDSINDTAYWYVQAESNATCDTNVNWNWDTKTGQYQLARVNWTTSSLAPLTKKNLYLCEDGYSSLSECDLYTGDSLTRHKIFKNYGTATVVCEVQNDFMAEPYYSNDTLDVGCWSAYDKYDGTEPSLELESTLYVCPGTHTMISMLDDAVIKNSGEYSMELQGPTIFDGGGVVGNHSTEADYRMMLWGYDLADKQQNPNGNLTIQNGDIGFYFTHNITNSYFANYKFNNMSVAFDLEQDHATNFSIINNTFTDCGTGGEDPIYISGENVEIKHNYFNALASDGDSYVYCDDCTNVTLEQNYYADISGLEIYSLGNSRNVQTPLGSLSCEIGEEGTQYPYNSTNNASLYGEITDYYPCTTRRESSPPSVTSLIENPTSPATYVYGQSYEFSATVIDPTGIDTVILTFNGVNYTATNTTANVYNTTIGGLSAGVYSYTWFANDSLGNSNHTEGGTYTITQASPGLAIGFVPSDTLPIGTQSTVTGEDCPSQISCNLYRNGASISNPDVQTFGAGVYPYVYNTTGNTNYTAYSITGNLTIANETCREFNIKRDSTGEKKFAINCEGDMSVYGDITPNSNGVLSIGTSVLRFFIGFFNRVSVSEAYYINDTIGYSGVCKNTTIEGGIITGCND